MSFSNSNEIADNSDTKLEDVEKATSANNSKNFFKKIAQELIASKKKTDDYTCWIADNNLITFSTLINSSEWYEYHNGYIVNYFQLVENKLPNEVIIYSSKMNLYYKIGPESLSYSRSLDGNYSLLYNGFWLTNSG